MCKRFCKVTVKEWKTEELALSFFRRAAICPLQAAGRGAVAAMPQGLNNPKIKKYPPPNHSSDGIKTLSLHYLKFFKIFALHGFAIYTAALPGRARNKSVMNFFTLQINHILLEGKVAVKPFSPIFMQCTHTGKM